MKTEFSNADHHAAEREGWWLSECSNGLYQIQRFDEDPAQRFASDNEAHAYVTKLAAAGSELHSRAIALDGKPFTTPGSGARQ